MVQSMVLKDTEKVIADIKIVGDRVIFIEKDGSLTIAARIQQRAQSVRVVAPPAPTKKRVGRRSNAEKAAMASASQGSPVRLEEEEQAA